MGFIQSTVGYVLGFIMWAIYKVIPNYGIALLIFTLITRLIQLPNAIKQQKSSAKMTMIQPRIQEVQEKYKDDRERQAEELQKLYDEEGYNPMAGCLPLLIQFPLLYGLIDVVYKPMTHILRFGKDLIETIQTSVAGVAGLDLRNKSMIQLDVVGAVKADPTRFEMLNTLSDRGDVVQKIVDLNYNFLGMNLMTRPTTDMLSISNFNPVILIPILSGVTALLSAIVSMRSMPSADEGGGGGMKVMMYIMPIFSVMIAFSVPAGVGLYWIYSNILMLAQSLYFNKRFNPKELAEKAKIEQEERKKAAREKARTERIEARKLAQDESLSEEERNKHAEKAMTQKELNRRRLAEARKRDAEKYGEEFVEVTDDDLV